MRTIRPTLGYTAGIHNATVVMRKMELLESPRSFLELLSTVQPITKAGDSAEVRKAWGYLVKVKIRSNLNGGEIWLKFDVTGRWFYVASAQKSPKKEWIWLSRVPPTTYRPLTRWARVRSYSLR